MLIGVTAAHYSIGFGIALLGVSYALVPGLFIPERMFDPNAVDSEYVQSATHA